MYYYCFGIYLDAQFCEQTCKKRENCRYYDINIYAKYKHMWDEMDFLVCQEPCQHYSPKREDYDVHERPDEDTLAF